MVTYEKLSRRPRAAASLIGMGLEAFDQLYAEFAVAHGERLVNLTVTRRKGTLRQRVVGAGGKHRYDLRNRLLMTLFWLRVYTTYEVMSFFYEMNKTNIEDNLKDILATLEGMTSFSYDRPGAQRKKLHSVSEVMDAFPALILCPPHVRHVGAI